jgi:hypothetical protein
MFCLSWNVSIGSVGVESIILRWLKSIPTVISESFKTNEILTNIYINISFETKSHAELNAIHKQFIIQLITYYDFSIWNKILNHIIEFNYTVWIHVEMNWNDNLDYSVINL